MKVKVRKVYPPVVDETMRDQKKIEQMKEIERLEKEVAMERAKLQEILERPAMQKLLRALKEMKAREAEAKDSSQEEGT